MNNKKVSILTFFFSHNYGAVLQAYAMSKIIKMQGFDVEFIDFRAHSANLEIKFPTSIRDLFLLYKYITIKLFIYRHFPKISKPIKSYKELSNFNFDADIFLVGSDQVWNLKHIGENYNAFFFEFVPDNVIKTAYAASFGMSEWDVNTEAKITEKIKFLLMRFHHICVREESGTKICKDTFGVNSNHVLDPTLVLGDFSGMTGKINVTKKKNIFRYFIHQNEEINSEIKKITTLTANYLHVEEWNNVKYIKYKDPKSWLKMIGGANYIITDSFHVCCFSILYEKPFLVYITKKSVATRIISLLKELGLDNRIFYNYDEVLDSQRWKEPIDYKTVKSKLQVLRENSITNLKYSLNIL